MNAAFDGHGTMNGATPAQPLDSESTESIGAAKDDASVQREALEQSLAAAQEAIIAGRARLAAREAALKEALREELMASRRRLSALDREHDERLAAIRNETERAIEAIMRESDVDGEQ